MTNPPSNTDGEPASFHARTLSASLTVKDVRASAAWYRDALGFTVEREHERGGAVRAVTLRAGEVRILLGQDDGAKGTDRAKGEGFSLMLTTEQDVDALARRVEAHGTALATPPTTMPWGPRAFRVQDPDGFKLTISSAPPA